MRDPTFNEDSRLASIAFKLEMEARLGRLMARDGMACFADYTRKIEELELKNRTCQRCNKVCISLHHLDYKHHGSRECKRLEAENQGRVYVPPGRMRVKCDICNKQYFSQNFPKHLESTFHKKRANTQILNCKLCNKWFEGKRPLKYYKAHLKTKKHLKNVAAQKVTL